MNLINDTTSNADIINVAVDKCLNNSNDDNADNDIDEQHQYIQIIYYIQLMTVKV